MSENKCEACKIIEKLTKGQEFRLGTSDKITLPPSAIEKGIALLLKDKCTCDKPVEVLIHAFGRITGDSAGSNLDRKYFVIEEPSDNLMYCLSIFDDDGSCLYDRWDSLKILYNTLKSYKIEGILIGKNDA